MQRLFGIAVIVGLVWLGITVFTQGTDAVFGRWFQPASASSARPTEPHTSPLDRIRAIGEGARDRQLRRIDSQLERERRPDE
jgi:hypothetical protein